MSAKQIVRKSDLFNLTGTGPKPAILPVYKDYLPPCNQSCPTGNDIQGFLALVREREFKKAWQKLVINQPMPAIHGRVCYHPCETGCNRVNSDSSVSIQQVERMLGDLALNQNWSYPQITEESGQKVLIIGAGPSGLAAAYHLRLAGHQVEIRDANPIAGGMMNYGIPAYRLPRDILQAEIKMITDMGVKITLNYKVENVLKEKQDGGFDAVFLADGKFVQGYYDYDSKKAGSRTVSHLRFGEHLIEAPWMIERASFVGINQFNFLTKFDCLEHAEVGATVLLNSPYNADDAWSQLPYAVQQQIITKKLSLYVLDAMKVAAETNMGRRINTIMQTGFFMLANVFPQQEAIAQIKHSIEVTYARKGQRVIEMNWNAVDHAVSATQKVMVPTTVTSQIGIKETITNQHPVFLQKVTKEVMAMRGDLIPVSEIPADGTFPSGTTQFDKHRQAVSVPSWDPELCIQCGNCSFICPHATIRAKLYRKDALDTAPENFKHADVAARGFPDMAYSIQVYAEDCMGCTLCVDACPAHCATDSNRKALQMVPAVDEWEKQAVNVEFFDDLPLLPINQVDYSTVKGVQFLPPHFQFPASCAGCGETAVVKTISQLFGERLMIANATGCSSIYGGNMPSTPWTQGANGCGPAWSNSLFEDNAEFGLGYRISVDHQEKAARRLLNELQHHIGAELVQAALNADQSTEVGCREQRDRVTEIRQHIHGHPKAAELDSVIDAMVKRSIWLMGGDGWAYDIGYGGLDHALGTSRNINILVMDTEVYSNTGGQASKATPLAATAKFAAGGKPTFRKELGLQAISYGNVYVAQICLNANPQQALQALREAEAYNGPSLILSYSPCIAHGFDMTQARQQAKKAVQSGHWPLYRYNPTLKERGVNPFMLDSLRPSITKADFMDAENRFSNLFKTNPENADAMFAQAQQVALSKWAVFEEMAETNPSWFMPELSALK